MAKDAPASAHEPADDGMNERDYAALLATLSASERGRAFLAEFARRQRATETKELLAAIARVEAMVAAGRAPLPARKRGTCARAARAHACRGAARPLARGCAASATGLG